MIYMKRFKNIYLYNEQLQSVQFLDMSGLYRQNTIPKNLHYK